MPFQRRGSPERVSKDGGGEPRWRGDGREIFFLEGSTAASHYPPDEGSYTL